MKHGRVLLNIIIGGMVIVMIVALRHELTNGMMYIKEVITHVGNGKKQADRVGELEREILVLKTKLEERQNREGVETEGNLEAKVYSRYPLNDRASLIISGGQKASVEKGMPVVTKEGVLVGSVEKTKRKQSEVKTIFDPLWKTGVTIGSEKVKGVLRGGSLVRVELVPRDAKIEEGDVVVNVSSDIPMGVPIGSIGKIQTKEGSTWITAEVVVPYELEELNEVVIIRDFP